MRSAGLLNPGLRDRERSRSVHFLKVQQLLNREGSRPLREKTSAACGVGRDAVSKALPGDCPPMHCPQLSEYQKVTLRTMQRTARPVGDIRCSRDESSAFP